jgi:hypothetical protein
MAPELSPRTIDTDHRLGWKEIQERFTGSEPDPNQVTLSSRNKELTAAREEHLRRQTAGAKAKQRVDPKTEEEAGAERRM